MPEHEYISLIKPPGYDVPGHTETYHILNFDRMSSGQRFKHISLPLIDGLLPYLQGKLVDIAKKSEFDKALKIVADEIKPGDQGFLFKVTEVMDAEGTATLAKEPISLIGLGDTPIDAIAESYAGTQISTDRIGGKHRNSYRWCTRSTNDLKITCADISLGKHLEKQGQNEAKRRSLQRTFMSRGPTIRALKARAEYWKETIQQKHDLIRAAGIQDKLTKWNSEIEQINKDFERAYKSYQDAVEKAAKYAQEMAFWGKVNAALGALQAVEAVNSRANMEDTYRKKLNDMETRMTTLESELNSKKDTIIKIDQSIVIEIQIINHHAPDFTPPVVQ